MIPPFLLEVECRHVVDVFALLCFGRKFQLGTQYCIQSKRCGDVAMGKCRQHSRKQKGNTEGRYRVFFTCQSVVGCRRLHLLDQALVVDSARLVSFFFVRDS